MAKLVYLLVLSLFFNCGSAVVNNKTVLQQCIDCVDYGDSMFVKVFWFSLNPPDYRCIRKKALSKFQGLIVDFTCELEYCEYIELSDTRFIWNNFTSDCHKLVDWQQVDISPQTYILWIQVFLLMFILALSSLGKFFYLNIII
jgi:hypothetical protein